MILTCQTLSNKSEPNLVDVDVYFRPSSNKILTEDAA